MKTRCLVLLVATTLACGGGSGASGSGGSKATGGGGGMAGGAGGAGGMAGKPDGGSTDGAAGGMGGSGMTSSRRLVGGRARLVGGPTTACSQPAGSGDHWCAFTLPAAMPLGATELWVLNVSKALAAEVPCDGTNPACLKLTSALWTGAPAAGVVHPFAHQFNGETLIFYANTPVSMQPYNGPIFAWRPGWSMPRQLTGANGYSCEGHDRSDAAVCFENVHLDSMNYANSYLDVRAGRVTADPQPLPLASRVYTTSDTNARVWSLAFSPAGDYFAYSTGAPMPGAKETVYAYKIDEVGMAAKRITVGNFADWSISGDGKRWYYLRDYNYPPRNSPIQPIGTLMAADFPGGANATLVAQQVGAYLPAGEKSVTFVDQVANGRGTYKFVKDATKPTEVATIATGVIGWQLSPDLRYSLVQTQVGTNPELTDNIIVKNDGTGRCPLAMGATSMHFGAAFSDKATWVYWADNVNPMTLEGEAWMANPDGCMQRHKFADNVDFWFLGGEAGLIFSDMATMNTANLKFARLKPGEPAAGGTLIRANVGRVYAPLGKERNFIVFQIADGGAEDGLYVHGPLGF